MGGAAQSANVSHLILYEPGLGTSPEEGAIERVEEALARDDREAAAEALLVGVVGMSPADVAFLSSASVWPSRLAVVHTMPREMRAEGDWTYRPRQFETITARTVVIAGSESTQGKRSLAAV